jgi:sortase A
MRKIIPCLIIIIGIFMIAYPQMKEVYADHKSNAIGDAIEKGDYEPIDITPVINDDVDPQANKILPEETKNNGKAVPIGIIKIDKIKIKYPILDGSSLGILDVAVGHVKGTALPGGDGNCALAAHRSFTYGRFFNRLDEVAVGDKVNIETKNNKYAYTIFEKKRVLPTDTSVLNNKTRSHCLTLITCDPVHNSTHRLILTGKIN